jgi:hypothetical protein
MTSAIANDFINLPQHYHTITNTLFQAPESTLGEVGNDGSVILDARYLHGQWVRDVIQMKKQGASLVLVKQMNTNNTNNMTFKTFMKNFSNNNKTQQLSPLRLEGVGTQKKPLTKKYTTKLPQFMQDIANASAWTSPFSNGGLLWEPLEFGVCRTTVGSFFASQFPNSGLDKLWLGTHEACITHRTMAKQLHNVDCFRTRKICRNNPLDCMYDWTAAMIIAHKNGSPIHVDTLDWPWLKNTSFVDAFGYVIQGPKAIWVAKGEALKTIGNWATTHNLAGRSGKSRTYASYLVNGTPPFPFQSVNSLGWPTVGQWADLANTYDIPNQWHIMDAGDLYFLFAKAPHSVLNNSSRCTVSIAKDDWF